MSDFPDLAALETRLRRHVAALASEPRPPGSTAHARARAYIAAHLKGAGLRVWEDAYAPPCANVLAAPLPERTGQPLVIVGAHYDSRPDTPGADDNASAVAALLELATWVGGTGLAQLQLAAYDEEEVGLVGSRHHAEQMTGPVRAMLSLEMLGYTDRRPGGQRLPPSLTGLYSDVGDFIAVIGNEASAGLVGTVTGALRQVAGLPVEALVVPGDGSALPDSRRSDHASFWDCGKPAVMVTDTSFLRNPHYHQMSDTPDTLDYQFLARVTAGVCRVVWALMRG